MVSFIFAPPLSCFLRQMWLKRSPHFQQATPMEGRVYLKIIWESLLEIPKSGLVPGVNFTKGHTPSVWNERWRFDCVCKTFGTSNWIGAGLSLQFLAWGPLRWKKPCKRHHAGSSIKRLTAPTGVSAKSSFSHLIRHNACIDNSEAPREHRSKEKMFGGYTQNPPYPP